MQNAVILGMLLTLLDRKTVTSKEFSIKYEISSRTVYRYIDTLNAAGVPVYSVSGKHGGFSIKDSFKLDAAFFTSEEYTRLVQSVTAFDVQDKLTLSVADKVKSLSRGLHADYTLKSGQLLVDAPTTPQMQHNLALLTKAVVELRVCRVEYHDAKGEITLRDLLPCCMVLKEGLWYIYAFCRLRGDYRFFKVSRIASLDLTEEYFEPLPYDIDGARALDTPKKSRGVDFCIKLLPSALTEVEEWLGVDSVIKTKDGYAAYATLPFDEFLISRLLSFCGKIEVIKPEELRAAIFSSAKKILSQYG